MVVGCFFMLHCKTKKVSSNVQQGMSWNGMQFDLM